MELKILHMSDTHGVHRRLRNLPEADILVHSGDFTMSGSEAETLDFLEWVCDLPYRHKVLVAGNHDACLTVLIWTDLMTTSITYAAAVWR